MKRKIRLTESEMVRTIERIVNEVKREKRSQFNESRYNRRRFLMEAEEEEAEIDAEIDDIGDEDNAERDRPLLDKIEKFAKKYKRLSKRMMRKLKRMIRKNSRQVITCCPKITDMLKIKSGGHMGESYRFLMEAEEEAMASDIEAEIDADDSPMPKSGILDKIEKFAKQYGKLTRKMKKIMMKLPMNNRKRYRKSFSCLSESESYRIKEEKMFLKERYQRLLVEEADINIPKLLNSIEAWGEEAEDSDNPAIRQLGNMIDGIENMGDKAGDVLGDIVDGLEKIFRNFMNTPKRRSKIRRLKRQLGNSVNNLQRNFRKMSRKMNRRGHNAVQKLTGLFK